MFRAPAGGSGWFNGRDDCGEVLAQGQCFRVFENAASVANVAKFIAEAVAVLEDPLATDGDKLFALTFIHGWVKDGAFVADSATFIADAEAAVAAADVTAASALATVTFTAKYEVLTDEGFHLDIIKKWFDSATTNMAPHGWRFSCRNRNSNVKGKNFFALLNEELRRARIQGPRTYRSEIFSILVVLRVGLGFLIPGPRHLIFPVMALSQYKDRNARSGTSFGL